MFSGLNCTDWGTELSIYRLALAFWMGALDEQQPTFAAAGLCKHMLY
jgi:hypothetical protein